MFSRDIADHRHARVDRQRAESRQKIGIEEIVVHRMEVSISAAAEETPACGDLHYASSISLIRRSTTFWEVMPWDSAEKFVSTR